MQEAYFTGKDLYSTMASQAFHTSYEDCLEFKLDENGNKTEITNEEGKKRRTQIKGIMLGIMYGRGTASVASNLGITTAEAEEIIENFFNAYPLIKVFIEERQKEAKLKGYTQTAWR